MSETNNAAQPATTETRVARPSAAFGTRGIIISQYDELVRFAETVSRSGLAPKGMESPQSIFVAVQMGLEVGLTPMAALQNVAVVNGRPTLWGDAQLAVCRSTGELETFEEWFEVNGVKTTRNPTEYNDGTTAVCKVKRTGGQEVESAFSVADAKRANLWGKAGPWTQYPFRMLRNRARSFGLRDTFGDSLKGFRSAEEVKDEETERDVTPVAETSALFPQAATALPAATVKAQVAEPVPQTVVERARRRTQVERKPEPVDVPAPTPAPQVQESLPIVEADVEAKPMTLANQVADRCLEYRVTWESVAEALHANALASAIYISPADAPDQVLTDALNIWEQVVAAANAMQKGGAR